MGKKIIAASEEIGLYLLEQTKQSNSHSVKMEHGTGKK